VKADGHCEGESGFKVRKTRRCRVFFFVGKYLNNESGEGKMDREMVMPNPWGYNVGLSSSGLVMWLGYPLAALGKTCSTHQQICIEFRVCLLK
jgi:hypothetical protein